MDQRNLGVARYDAGAEYLDALRRLKLEPEALFWAYDRTLEQYVLVVVTSLFDFAPSRSPAIYRPWRPRRSADW